MRDQVATMIQQASVRKRVLFRTRTKWIPGIRIPTGKMLLAGAWSLGFWV